MAFKMKNPSLAKLAKNMGQRNPVTFNAKLKKASAEGKLSGKFKEAVDNSPMPKKGEKSKFKSSEEVYKFNADALKNTLSPDFKGSPKATENTKKIMKRYNLKEIPNQVDFKKLEADYQKRKKNVKVKTLPEVEVAATKMKKPATKMKKKTIATKKGERGMLKSKDRKGNVEYHQGYTFKEAFADARKEGVKTFTHGGKKYNTKLAKSGKTEGISAFDKLPRTEGISALDKLAKIAGKTASKTAGKTVGKALTKAAKKSKTKKTSQEDFKPAFEGGDYSKADLAKMTPKQRKKIEEGQQ